jgi:hypothetical protein
MIEVKKKQVPYAVVAMCDCGGELTKLSHVTAWPNPNATYLHKCNKCGKHENLKKIYPTVEFEDAPPPGQEE